jgi:hypothetical protein
MVAALVRPPHGLGKALRRRATLAGIHGFHPTCSATPQPSAGSSKAAPSPGRASDWAGGRVMGRPWGQATRPASESPAQIHVLACWPGL